MLTVIVCLTVSNQRTVDHALPLGLEHCLFRAFSPCACEGWGGRFCDVVGRMLRFATH